MQTHLCATSTGNWLSLSEAHRGARRRLRAISLVPSNRRVAGSFTMPTARGRHGSGGDAVLRASSSVASFLVWRAGGEGGGGQDPNVPTEKLMRLPYINIIHFQVSKYIWILQSMQFPPPPFFFILLMVWRYLEKTHVYYMRASLDNFRNFAF